MIKLKLFGTSFPKEIYTSLKLGIIAILKKIITAKELIKIIKG